MVRIGFTPFRTEADRLRAEADLADAWDQDPYLVWDHRSEEGLLFLWRSASLQASRLSYPP